MGSVRSAIQLANALNVVSMSCSTAFQLLRSVSRLGSEDFQQLGFVVEFGEDVAGGHGQLGSEIFERGQHSADVEQLQTHNRLCEELSSYKLSPITGYDPDGYHRVICPAAQGKLRCPLRPASMELPYTRPQVLTPPEHPPTCCQQTTITVPASINAKTAQKHDYPSAAHRDSYARRSGAERTYATVKDPATNDLSRARCRLTGLTPIALSVASVFIARNLRIADAFATRQAEDQRRAANGLPPKQRKRRRQSAKDLISAANAPP